MKSTSIASRFKIAIPTAMLFLFPACADSPFAILFSPPECQMFILEKKDHEPGHPAQIVMSVENTGSKNTAYSVGCSIKLKRGNTIIDRSVVGFGTLQPGEAAINEAWFSRIEKHSEYDHAEYTLYWYDAEGGYYEN